MSLTEVMEPQTVMKKRQTLVRRVSDLFKEGKYSGPPSLFRHTSMQRIRHCCQNLNLFPYLLYSFDNSKSHPLAKKVNLGITHILKKIAARFFLVYASFRHVVLRQIRSEAPVKIISAEPSKAVETTPKFTRSRKEKPKQNSYFLILAIYLAPLVLAFQLVAICSLLVFENHTPGFIFLFTALLCLGYISLKVMVSDTVSRREFKNEKRKLE
ncbi:uncharacterized protein LOC117181622 isoform X2 [Belonocnema kinseyi]|uniref:uncharacterized protein LOC117181622 isoform X2 n=1 Tax=Belonocnema kinseyi TaxID=2817044 RepID=UPI00143CE6DC|nr:uncharacterized protein LOC117181622 isoform X2 [Belonocnema kinseyi]